MATKLWQKISYTNCGTTHQTLRFFKKNTATPLPIPEDGYWGANTEGAPLLDFTHPDNHLEKESPVQLHCSQRWMGTGKISALIEGCIVDHHHCYYVLKFDRFRLLDIEYPETVKKYGLDGVQGWKDSLWKLREGDKVFLDFIVLPPNNVNRKRVEESNLPTAEKQQNSGGQVDSEQQKSSTTAADPATSFFPHGCYTADALGCGYLSDAYSAGFNVCFDALLTENHGIQDIWTEGNDDDDDEYDENNEGRPCYPGETPSSSAAAAAPAPLTTTIENEGEVVPSFKKLKTMTGGKVKSATTLLAGLGDGGQLKMASAGVFLTPSDIPRGSKWEE